MAEARTHERSLQALLMAHGIEVGSPEYYGLFYGPQSEIYDYCWPPSIGA